MLTLTPKRLPAVCHGPEGVPGYNALKGRRKYCMRLLTLSGSVTRDSISESSRFPAGGGEDVGCLLAKLNEKRLRVELNDDVRSRSLPVESRSAFPTDPSRVRLSLATPEVGVATVAIDALRDANNSGLKIKCELRRRRNFADQLSEFPPPDDVDDNWWRFLELPGWFLCLRKRPTSGGKFMF